MQPESCAGIALVVTDVSKQRTAKVRDVPAEASIGELVQELLESMHFPAEDPSGRPLSYRARLDREGRHLNSSERVGTALRTGDELILQPSVDAAGGGL